MATHTNPLQWIHTQIHIRVCMLLLELEVPEWYTIIVKMTFVLVIRITFLLASSGGLHSMFPRRNVEFPYDYICVIIQKVYYDTVIALFLLNKCFLR